MEEEPLKEQQQPPANISGSAGKSKLRYPLRSSMKSKEEKPAAGDLSTSSSSARVRRTPSVSKSVGALDLSKEKSAKPPRRLSIPTKSTVTPSPKLVGTITPISEARAKKSTNGQSKSDTPLSDASRSATRRRFNVLSSASYWLSQIKLSESASKHSVSLGFFKLALQAGCEQLKKMHDELKSYVRRHNLDENGEAIKELLESYNNVSENSDQPQVSQTCSQVPEEGTRSSDDEVHSVSSAVGSRKLIPKSLNTDAAQVSSVAKSAKETTPKNNPVTRNRVLNKNSSNSRSVSEMGNRKLQNKTQKTTKPEPVKGKDKIKKQGTKEANEEGKCIDKF
ncbi:hypothetical protein REPUB_Repub07fG0064000 [Reevesia pubescens]